MTAGASQPASTVHTAITTPTIKNNRARTVTETALVPRRSRIWMSHGAIRRLSRDLRLRQCARSRGTSAKARLCWRLPSVALYVFGYRQTSRLAFPFAFQVAQVANRIAEFNRDHFRGFHTHRSGCDGEPARWRTGGRAYRRAPRPSRSAWSRPSEANRRKAVPPSARRSPLA